VLSVAKAKGYGGSPRPKRVGSNPKYKTPPSYKPPKPQKSPKIGGGRGGGGKRW